MAAWSGLLAVGPWLHGERDLATLQAVTALGAIALLWVLRGRFSAGGPGAELALATTLAAALLPAAVRWRP